MEASPCPKSHQFQLTASRNVGNSGITCQATYWHTDKGDEARTRLCICVHLSEGALTRAKSSTCPVAQLPVSSGAQQGRREKMEP